MEAPGSPAAEPTSSVVSDEAIYPVSRVRVWYLVPGEPAGRLQGEDGGDAATPVFDYSKQGSRPASVPEEEAILSGAVVYLRKVGDANGYTASSNRYENPSTDEARDGDVRVTLAELSTLGDGALFSPRAMRAMVEAIIRSYSGAGVGAVLADISDEVSFPSPNPAPGDEEGRGRDYRTGRQGDEARELRVAVLLGRIGSLTTRAEGTRFPLDTRPERAVESMLASRNRPEHAWILETSPVTASTPAARSQDGRDVVLKDQIEGHLARLNRHRGRRVDAVVSPGENVGEVAIDFVVNELRPWSLYAEVSNTGTKSTGELRERFGLRHDQLTGRDDSLSLEFLTANFEDTFAVTGSYEFPLQREVSRARAYGQWSQFTARDVALPGEDIKGDSWGGGLELSRTVTPGRYSPNPNFIDLVAGARVSQVSSSNTLNDQPGDATFLVPYVGARYERNRLEASTFANLQLDFSPGAIAGGTETDLINLGRAQTSDRWTALRWQVSHSFFLEPLLSPTAFRNPGGDPDSLPTLAHEVVVSLQGQYAFDERLTPTEEQAVGGLYTVRGYPESIIAGDNVYAGSIEYRWHIPWSWIATAQAEPDRSGGASAINRWLGGFRAQPTVPYGRADWDLIAKVFVDAAHVTTGSPELAGEGGDLVGAGIGLELQLKRNLSARVDWGFPMVEVENRVNEGESRVHFSLYLSY